MKLKNDLPYDRPNGVSNSIPQTEAVNISRSAKLLPCSINGTWKPITQVKFLAIFDYYNSV